MGRSLDRGVSFAVRILCYLSVPSFFFFHLVIKLMRFAPNAIAAILCIVLLTACGGGDGSTAPATTPPIPTPTPAPTPSPTPGASASVAAGDNSNIFTPASVEVARGAVVTWTFGARPHNVIFNSTAGAPSNVEVTSNAQVARTFNTVGSFAYDCTLHSGMTGTVVVR